MYTDEEKQIAKKLLENEEYLELIAKVFLTTEDKLDSSFVHGKDNEKLGEIVRANVLAEEKVKSRFNILKSLARTNTGVKQKPVVKS